MGEPGRVSSPAWKAAAWSDIQRKYKWG